MNSDKENISPELAYYRKNKDEINKRRRKLYAEDEWYRKREIDRHKRSYQNHKPSYRNRATTKLTAKENEFYKKFTSVEYPFVDWTNTIEPCDVWQWIEQNFSPKIKENRQSERNY